MTILNNIKTKLIIYILSIVSVIYIVSITIIIGKTKEASYEEATKLADSYASQYANLAKAQFNSYIENAYTLEKIFENYKETPEEIRRKLFSEMLKVTLNGNSQFLSVWSIWETNSMDRFDNQYRNKVGSTVLGNFRYEYSRQGKEIKLSDYIEQDSSQVLSGKIYSNLKQNRKEIILDPYYYSYSRNKKDEVMLTTFSTPIMVDGKFMGILGIDFLLGSQQDIIKGANPFEKSFAVLISNNGTIIAHTNKEYIGKNINDLTLFRNDSLSMRAKISSGQPYLIKQKSDDGTEYYISFYPIHFGETSTP